MRDSIKAGNIVIIQFGHNDKKADPKLFTDPYTTFKQNLKKFIDETKVKKATPIICTSIVRRQFDEIGNLKDTHGAYIPATREVATENHPVFVDMKQSLAS